MKSIIVTDTHLGIKNNSKFWLDLIYNLFVEVVDRCVREGIDSVIFMGDFFHNRKTLNVLSINRAHDICSLFCRDNVTLYLIRGNHDQYFNNQSDPHSLKQFEEYSYVNVINDVYKFDDKHYLVPWGSDISDIPDNITIFGHFEINNVIMNASGRHMDNAKYKISDFKRFNIVYSGHFHTPSKNNNITYIGSAFAMDFNDVDSKRGYYIYDDGDMEFIEYTDAPKFVKIKSNDDIVDDVIKDNFIELTFVEDYGNVKNDKLIQDVTNMKPEKLFVKYNIDMSDDELVMDEGEEFSIDNNRDVFLGYIDQVKDIPKNINKKMLKSVLVKLEEGE